MAVKLWDFTITSLLLYVSAYTPAEFHQSYCCVWLKTKALLPSAGVYLLFFLEGCPFVGNIFSSPEALIEFGASEDRLSHWMQMQWACGSVRGLWHLLGIVHEKDVIRRYSQSQGSAGSRHKQPLPGRRPPVSQHLFPSLSSQDLKNMWNLESIVATAKVMGTYVYSVWRVRRKKHTWEKSGFKCWYFGTMLCF